MDACIDRWMDIQKDEWLAGWLVDGCSVSGKWEGIYESTNTRVALASIHITNQHVSASNISPGALPVTRRQCFQLSVSGLFASQLFSCLVPAAERYVSLTVNGRD